MSMGIRKDGNFQRKENVKKTIMMTTYSGSDVTGR